MRNIVVLAHDKKKPEMATFIKEREDWLWGRTLVATGRSAEYLEGEGLTLPVNHLSPGQSGGYNEITAMIKSKKVDLVLFFIDPEVKEGHHPDIEEMINTCIRYDVPLSTSTTAHELLILGQIRKEMSERSKAKS